MICVPRPRPRPRPYKKGTRDADAHDRVRTQWDAVGKQTKTSRPHPSLHLFKPPRRMR
jgi:hypothetical protein